MSFPKPIFSYQYQGFIFETYNEKPVHLPLKEINQTHSCIQQNIHQYNIEQADALNFNAQDLDTLVPSIKTADCLPIWVITKQRHYLIHAGWRGLADNIISKSIKYNQIEFALIGPAICKKCFEVQKDFTHNFPQSKFFQILNNKLTFNLKEQAKLEMQSNQLVSIKCSGLCTYEHSNLHSFRLNGTLQRNWSIVRRAS